MKLPIVLICSFFIAFFISFILIFILAKITSVSAKVKKNSEEHDTAGIKYNCVVKNVDIKNKLSQVVVKTNDKTTI